MTNRPNGTLHVGETEDPVRRVAQHRNGTGSAFARNDGLTGVVYAERHEAIARTIQRETNVKDGPRAWKVRLIQALNPQWRDLDGEFDPWSRHQCGRGSREVVGGGPSPATT